MNDISSREPRLAVGLFLSVSGSVASLAALAIVFIDKLAASYQIDPQFVVWRLTLCFASLVAIGATITLAYHFISSAVTALNLTAPARIFRVGILAVLGLLATAVFVDALFASIYWRWWLGDLTSIVLVSSPQKDPIVDANAQVVGERSSALKSIDGKTINIFFADGRSPDALRAKSELEQVGAHVGLIRSEPRAIQPNTVYYRNVSVLEAALEIEKILAPFGVTNRALATWGSPSADVIVLLR